MNDQERARFDAIVEDVIEALPDRFRELVEEVPVIVLDEPTPEILGELGVENGDAEALDEICGLHTGVMLTERSIEHPENLPEMIHLFRRGILSLAGGWEEHEEEDEEGSYLVGGEEDVREQIRITLLHEIGHHFGLDEGDLEELGYD